MDKSSTEQTGPYPLEMQFVTRQQQTTQFGPDKKAGEHCWEDQYSTSQKMGKIKGGLN